jgi:hypothetical protein
MLPLDQLRLLNAFGFAGGTKSDVSTGPTPPLAREQGTIAEIFAAAAAKAAFTQ